MSHGRLWESDGTVCGMTKTAMQKNSTSFTRISFGIVPQRYGVGICCPLLKEAFGVMPIGMNDFVLADQLVIISAFGIVDPIVGRSKLGVGKLRARIGKDPKRRTYGE